MKYFALLLLCLHFITQETTCMFRSFVMRKKTRNFCRYERSESEQLHIHINELEKTITSLEDILYEQHVIIRELRREIAKQNNNDKKNHFTAAINPSNSISTASYIPSSSYIPEHNMHYGNKAHE